MATFNATHLTITNTTTRRTDGARAGRLMIGGMPAGTVSCANAGDGLAVRRPTPETRAVVDAWCGAVAAVYPTATPEECMEAGFEVARMRKLTVGRIAWVTRDGKLYRTRAGTLTMDTMRKMLAPGGDEWARTTYRIHDGAVLITTADTVAADNAMFRAAMRMRGHRRIVRRAVAA